MTQVFRRWKKIWVVLGTSFLVYLWLPFLKTRLGYGSYDDRFATPLPRGRPPPKQTLRSLSLDEVTCDKVFPGLAKDVDDTVALGPFSLKQARNMGPLQIRLKDGQLYIVHKEDKDVLTHEMLDSRIATLHQIHRAILTSPHPLPDTIFSVNVQDEPVGTAWSYSRPAYAAPTPGNPPIFRAFLMPHFAFWAWPLPFVGSFSRAADSIEVIEAKLPFPKKDARAVWRGTKRYNSAHNPRLRGDLLRTTKDAPWADVQELEWDQIGSGADKRANATNSLNIEDFCKYKYVLHTEGITYSGRFQFLQMCRSVLLTPPIAWLQHTTHLIRPLFSAHLDLGMGKKTWVPSEGEQKAWPVHYRPEEANAVFVAPDWSDLEATIRWLEAHPVIAEGIATRQRELFVDRGYLSPAAEACYWRALVRGWSKVVRTEGEGWEEQPGVRWELFAMGYES